MITLNLPWPDKRLSPNARGDWHVKEEPRKSAKEIGVLLTRDLYAQDVDNLPIDLKMWVTFHPPRNGRYDLDNALSKCKHYLDGVFEGIGRDDSEVSEIVLKRGKPLKGGMITIILGET
jgi:crossover junction endodeoxyribonuclease RusA